MIMGGDNISRDAESSEERTYEVMTTLYWL